MTMTLSTHVLDLDSGAPAAGLTAHLEQGAQLLATATTNNDGRIAQWPGIAELPLGIYQLRFDTSAWYAQRNTTCFYPQVSIEFSATEARHYHVPLLLNRHGYSTYRGS